MNRKYIDFFHKTKQLFLNLKERFLANKIVCFIKKFFNKISQFIQWTKKWHFFHVLMWLIIIILIILCVAIFITISNIPETNTISNQSSCYNINPEEELAFLAIIFFYMFAGVTYISIPIAFIISLIIFVVNKKLCTIQNKILLQNNLYNSIYLFFYIFLCFILLSFLFGNL